MGPGAATASVHMLRVLPCVLHNDSPFGTHGHILPKIAHVSEAPRPSLPAAKTSRHPFLDIATSIFRPSTTATVLRLSAN